MADQLDLRDLRYFEAIAAAGHVGRAARAIHRAQPTLTGAVRRLEERLGTPLFERAGRGIRLTAAGAALYAHSQSLRLAAEDAERAVADVGAGQAGLVRIGLVPTAARFLMPKLCRDFLRDSPGLSFRLIVTTNDEMRASLKAGELDLTVSLMDPADEDIVSHTIVEDQCVVVGRRSHPIFRGKATVGDLTRYGWVLSGRSVATRDWLEHTFRTLGLPPPKVAIETNQLLFLPALIEESELLSFISRRHLAPQSKLREVPFRQTTWQREFALCHRKDAYLSPAARRVIEALRTEGRAIFG